MCPFCKSTKTKVVDKRNSLHENSIRRRRECLSCHKRFTTYERVEHVDLSVQKRDGSIEHFNREKIRNGILKAVKEGSLTEDQIYKIIDDIETDLLNYKTNIIPSSYIGKLVLNRLYSIDPVAYIRFASVYKEFNSIDDLLHEINFIRESHESKNGK